MSPAGVFIAVTAPVRESDIGLPRVVLEEGYLVGVRLAGGLPLILSPLIDEEGLELLFGSVSGLLLTGGEDIDPVRYGQTPDGALGISPARDALEITLAERALERGLPVFAICRGMQLLNVALGGTLWQDLATQRVSDVDHDRYEEFDAPIHGLRAERSPRLDGVFPDREFDQNSAHHQGVRELAEELRAVAWASDDLIEGVERTGREGWIVGVQWHPERRLEDPVNRRLFERFGEEVRRVAERNGRP